MPLPWSRKQGEELPDELKGMEAKDLVDAIAKSKEVDKLRADLTAAQAKASEVDEVKEQLRKLDAKVNPPPEPLPNNGPVSFLDDENQAFNQRLAPFAITTLRNQASAAKFMAVQSLKPLDRKIWDKYSDEIDEVMKSVDLQNQAVPQTWTNALDIVAGRHRNDIVKMVEDKTDFFLEVPSNGGRGAPGTSDPDAPLSQEQRDLAKRLGITDDDYKKNMKEMTIRA